MLTEFLTAATPFVDVGLGGLGLALYVKLSHLLRSLVAKVEALETRVAALEQAQTVARVRTKSRRFRAISGSL